MAVKTRLERKSAVDRSRLRARRVRGVLIHAAAAAALVPLRARAQVYVGSTSQGDTLSITTATSQFAVPVSTVADGNTSTPTSFPPFYGAAALPTGTIYINDNGSSGNTNYFGASTLTMNGGAIAYYGKSTTTIQNLDVVTQGSLAAFPNNATATIAIGNLTTSSTATMTFQSRYNTIGSGTNDGAFTIGSINGTALTGNNTTQMIGGWATVSTAQNGADTYTHFAANGPNGIQGITGTVTLAAATAAGGNSTTLNVDDGSGNGLSGNLTINSLTSNNGDILLNGYTLTLQSGGLIMGGSSHWLKSSGNLTAGAGGNYTLFATVNDSATDFELNGITVTDNGNNSVSFVKGGVGQLAITHPETFTGALVVNAGTLAFIGNGNSGGTVKTASSITINSGAAITVSGDNNYLGSSSNILTTVYPYGTLSISGSSTAHLGALTLAGGTLATSGNLTGDGVTYGTWNLDHGVTAGNTTATSTISATDVALTESGGSVFNVASGSTSGVDLDVTGTFFNSTSSSDYGLVKTGAGVMRLDSANSYKGSTTISAGTLLLNNPLAVQNSTVSMSGGSLIFSPSIGNFTLGGLGGSGNIVLNDTNSAAVTLLAGNNGGNTTYSGSLSGAGALTKIGVGTLTLSGNSTYFGGTTLSAGILNLGSAQIATAGPLGNLTGAGVNGLKFSGGTLQFSSNNAFDYSPYFSTAASQQFNIDTNGQSVTFAAAITSSGGTLAKLGSGNLTLSGNSTYSGGTTLSAGILNVGSAQIANAGPLGNLTAAGANGLKFSGAMLQFSGNNAFDYSPYFSTAASQQFNIDTNGQSVAFVTAITSSGGTLTKLGSGNLTLSAANSYSGVTTISAGTLQLSNALAVQNSTVSMSGGSLTFAPSIGNFTLGGLGGSGNIALTDTSSAAVTLLAGNNGGNTTYSGSLGGAGALTKIGAGTLTLTGGSTFSGSLVVSAGTLFANRSILNNGNISTALGQVSAGINRTITVDTGATLSFIVNNVFGNGGSPTNIPTIVLNGGTLTGTHYNTLGNVTLLGGNLTQNSAETGSGYQDWQFLGTITVSGNSSSTIDNNLAATETGDHLGSNTVFNVASTGAGPDLIVLNPLINPSSDFGGTGALTKTGTGVMALEASNSYSGATVISAGTLDIGGSTANGSILANNNLTMAGGTLLYTRTGTNTQTFGNTTLAASTTSSIQNSVSTDMVALGNLIRNAGSTVDFTPTGSITTVNANTGTTILGGWATVGGTNWAVSAGNGTTAGNITVLGSYIEASAAGSTSGNYTAVDLDVDSSQAPTGAISPNSIRFNTAAPVTMTLTGNNTITAGGILITSNVGNNSSTITGGVLEGSSGGELTVNQFNSANSLSVASVIANNGNATALTKAGVGLLALTGANSYTGATYITQGTLQLGSAGLLGNGTYAGNIANYGTFNYSSSATDNLSGIISGSGALVVNGPGKLFLNASSSYSGGTTVNSGGFLAVGASNLPGSQSSYSLGSGNVTINAGGTLALGYISTSSTAYNFANSFAVNSGTIIVEDGYEHIQGAINVTGNSTILVNYVDKGIYLDGPVSGSGNLTAGFGGSDSGTASYDGAVIHFTNGNSTYSGAITVKPGSNSAGPGGSYLEIDAGNALANASIILAGNNTGTGGSSNAHGSGTLLFGNGTDAVAIGALSGNGSAVLADQAATPNAVTLTIGGTGLSSTFSGALSGNGSIVKAGSGSFTMNGSSSYAGNTSVSAGSLFANNSHSSLGTGVVNVNGGLLAGNGTINNGVNSLTVNNGGTLGAGADATHTGTLATGNQTWAAGGTLAIKINSATGTAGAAAGWDQVTMSGLTLSGLSGSASTFAVTLASFGNSTASTALSNYSPITNYTWQIASIAGTTLNNIGTPIILAETDSTGHNVAGDSSGFTLDTSSFVTTNNSAGDGFFSLEAVDSGGNDALDISYTATPEPGSTLLMLCGTAPLLLTRRRRRAARQPD